MRFGLRFRIELDGYESPRIAWDKLLLFGGKEKNAPKENISAVF